MTHSKSRRDFCKDTIKVTATGVLASQVLSASNVFAGAADEIKIALVGCGGRGTGAAAQALTADPSVSLVAMADIFQDRLDSSFKGLKGKYGTRVKVDDNSKFVAFDGYKKAIDMADVVLLTTPPGFRPVHFEYAVEKGKHVFMEKPLATDVAGIKKVIEASKIAREKKLNVIVGLQRHYQKNYRTIKKMQEEGAFGDIISGQVYWNSAGVWVKERKPEYTELEYQMRNWYYFNWICGDHILEQHIHNIDVANWFIGAHPVSAQGMGGRQVRTGKEYGQIFDHHFVEFVYPEGQVISSQCRHQRGCMNRVDERLHGTKGSVLLDSNNVGRITGRDGSVIYDYVSENDVNPYQQEHNELFASIRAGSYDHDDTPHGIDATMSAILGRMATYTGNEITWDEALATDMNLVPDINSFEDMAPVQPDENGFYPVPMPGQTKLI